MFLVGRREDNVRCKKILAAFLLAMVSVVTVAGMSACVTPGSTTNPTVSSIQPTTNGTGTTTSGTRSGVTAAPNDSLITANVLDITRLQNVVSDPWEITIKIQATEDVPGMYNPFKNSIGKTISVRTSEDISALKKGQVITVQVKGIGDEHMNYLLARNTKVVK
jgi:hypothetical protein